MNNHDLAIAIRILAINAPNRDVMSCEFGNWFAPGVEELLDKQENLREQLTYSRPTINKRTRNTSKIKASIKPRQKNN